MVIGRILAAAGLACGLAMLGGAAFAGDQVKSAIGATIRTYTEKGEINGEIQSKSLKFPVDVVRYDDKRRPGVMVDGSLRFLKPADVIMSVTTSACTPIATAKKASDSRLAASEVGVSAGMSEHAVACVPK